MLLLLASCAALELPDDAFPSPTLTPLPTSTIDWFPASATPTFEAFATQTATPEMKPGLGREIFSDDFSEPEHWLLAVDDQASTAIQADQLRIAVEPGVYMISLQQERVLDDFYAEISAHPNLCRGTDEYGMLVRATSVAYYRFGLSCSGTVRADRAVYGRSEERHILHEAVPSGDAPPGAPGEVRIGVWAVGREMRLFLNGRFQFSITDPNYASGLIGVFARSAGDTPVTVSFSDLQVREVDSSFSTGTLQP